MGRQDEEQLAVTLLAGETWSRPCRLGRRNPTQKGGRCFYGDQTPLECSSVSREIGDGRGRGRKAPKITNEAVSGPAAAAAAAESPLCAAAAVSSSGLH